MLIRLIAFIVILWSVSAFSSEAKVGAAFDSACEPFVIEHIDAAKTNIQVAIYCFTRRNISKALIRADERGVKVVVKYDKHQAEDEDMKELIDRLAGSGIKCEPIEYEQEQQKMHNKFIVIDGRRVLTGSYNFTTNASSGNAENMVCIESEEIAGKYSKAFESIKSVRNKR